MSNDLISRQDAIDAIMGEYPDAHYPSWYASIIEKLPSAQPDVPDIRVGNTISRQAAIDALWKALYEYEDRTEKQFQESDELDVEDWIQHRIFVQNMNDIDRQAIMELPSAQPEIIRCKDCKYYGRADKRRFYRGSDCLMGRIATIVPDRDFCSRAERRTDGHNQS